MVAAELSTIALVLFIGLFTIAIIADATDSSTIWVDYPSQNIIALNITTRNVCIGGNCSAGWELSIEHNASINGSPICTATNGVCGGTNNTYYYYNITNNITSNDGTGGWTNTSTTTSTNLNVNITNTTYILKDNSYGLKVEQRSATIWTTPLEILRLSATTAHTDNIMTGFGPKIVFEGDAGGGSHYDMGYLQSYYQYAANSIGRHWTGFKIVLQNEYGAQQFLDLAEYSSSSGTAAIGIGSTVAGQYGVAIGGAQNAGTGGVSIGVNNDNYGNSGSAAIYGGTHNHDNGGNSAILGLSYVYNNAANNVVIGDWLAPSASNTVTIGSGAVGSAQFGNNVENSIRMGANNVEYLWFKPTTLIFNGGGNDVDFNVKGNTSTNLLYGDAALNRLGINTATPTQTLDINGSGNYSGVNAQLWVNGSEVCTTGNGLCATTGGGNATFNQSLTDELYAGTAGLQNYTFNQISTNIGNWTADKNNYLTSLAGTAINTTAKLEAAWTGNSTLYTKYADVYSALAGNGNWSADKSTYATLTAVYAALGGNGNWSSDKSSYATLTAVYAALAGNGNWSADKSSYALDGRVTTVNATAVSKAATGVCPLGQFINGTNSSSVLCATPPVGAEADPAWTGNQSLYLTSLAGTAINTTAKAEAAWTGNSTLYATLTAVYTIENANGNWSADKSSYVTIAGTAANSTNLNNKPSGYYLNSTGFVYTNITGYIPTAAGWTNVSTTNTTTTMNITMNTLGNRLVIGNTATAPGGYITSNGSCSFLLYDNSSTLRVALC